MRHYEVRDVMTADPVTVTPATPIKDLAGILVKQRIGALPVVTPHGRPGRPRHRGGPAQERAAPAGSGRLALDAPDLPGPA